MHPTYGSAAPPEGPVPWGRGSAMQEVELVGREIRCPPLHGKEATLPPGLFCANRVIFNGFLHYKGD